MTFRSRSSEEPPLKKNKASLTLPDDLLLSCFARVSRLYYPTLSLVSKRFRSLLASPELQKVRSLLNLTETCLYVSIRFSPESDPRWFTLCEKPNQNQTKRKKKKKSGYALAKIPMTNSPPAHWEGVVALGYNIYNIGGSKDRSSNVSILDCRSHTCHEAPSMQVERRWPSSAHVFDGKIYVAGGGGGRCNYYSSNFTEVFEPKTQTWEIVTDHVAKKTALYISGMIEREEIYRFRKGGFVYKEDKWKAIKWGCFSHCVIDNIIYWYSYLQGMKWYNSKVGYWVTLKLLERLPKIRKYSCVKLVSYGGKMVVLWDKNLPSSSGNEGKTVFCAVIALEKRNDKEILGTVESVDDVLTVPNSYEFVCAASPTL